MPSLVGNSWECGKFIVWALLQFFTLRAFKQNQRYYNTANKGKCGISKHLWVAFISWTAAYISKVLCQHCPISLQQVCDGGESALMTRAGQPVVQGPDSACQIALSHHLENHWLPNKLRAWWPECVQGSLQSVLRQAKHSANRDPAVRPAGLTGWQQSLEQLVVPAWACAHHLSVRFGAGCECPGGEPWLFTWWLPTLGWRAYVAIGCCRRLLLLSWQNECLQHHCKLVNRYPLFKRKGQRHFPFPLWRDFPSSQAVSTCLQ